MNSRYRPKRKHADSNISEEEVSSKGVRDEGSGDEPTSWWSMTVY